MFRRLRVKLAVLYASLFCAALVFIGVTVYLVIASNTHRLAGQQLASAGAVFERIRETRLAQLGEGADRFAASAAFQSAAAARDQALVRAHLANLRADAGADLAFFVTAEGLIVGDNGAGTSISPGLQRALSVNHAPAGLMHAGGALYQAVVRPVPGRLGWVVIGAHLDRTEMTALQPLFPGPVEGAIVTRNGDNWLDEAGRNNPAINVLLDGAVSGSPHAGQMLSARGDTLALIQPVASLDGARRVLVLRYSLAGALSPYGALFGTLIAGGAAALALLLIGSWFLARSITQPLSTLEEAAKHLQQGVYDPVVVSTKDELSRLAESFNAMAEAIKERERRITQLAYHDAETRLPNRLALERKVTAAQQRERLYLAAIGVERFAHVRGAIGYTLAGVLMRTLGARLARLAPNAPMARLSSDVLGVAFLADNENDARRLSEAFANNLEQPFSLEDQTVDIQVTIGVAQPRGKQESASAMIERASIALDQARQARQKVSTFDEAAYGDPARNLSLMGEMRRALEAGAIDLAHQPKYNFRTGRIDSAETLVRWRHPTRGMISPDLFVPMAEETGHIQALTEWVLARAVADQQRLGAAGADLTLSVNISARLLSDGDFARRAVELARPAAHRICFEITETAVIDNPTAALENIELFAASGIRIAIDDYGAGLSSLAYLKQLPAHELKIDKLFVQNLTNSERDALLVRSTIDLAHGLDLEVTAEGVETPAAFAMLAAMNCDLAQGYLVSRPCTLDELVAIANDEPRLRFYQQSAAAGKAAPGVRLA